MIKCQKTPSSLPEVDHEGLQWSEKVLDGRRNVSWIIKV